MATIARFEDLDAWKEARTLSRLIYRHTSAGQLAKDCPLRDQIRRAVISVMSTIAEGFERGGDAEFVQFLAIAKGSCGEVRSQLFIALDQEYMSREQFEDGYRQCARVCQLIAGMQTYLIRARKSGRRGLGNKSSTTHEEQDACE